MKILWANPNLLHPTTKGGQIRTLEMLKVLSRRHEVHYVAYDDGNEEGRRRAGEYCARLHVVPLRPPPRRSARFALQLVHGLVSPLPVSILRYRSQAMSRCLGGLVDEGGFDRMVCDFLTLAPAFPELGRCVYFSHNVEGRLWERHAREARDPLRRWYFGLQARRMVEFERHVCRQVRSVIAVSPVDAAHYREHYGIEEVDDVPTGVDVARFTPPDDDVEPRADLSFVGSMDYLPNADGVRFFVEEVLPRIWERRPSTTFAVVGRRPTPEIEAYGRRDPRITVTGTVPDVRPWLWGSLVSVVPLLVGGGTRIKIYEAMAARRPVVSTSLGAEGLAVEPGRHILVADDPQSNAARCLELLDDPGRRAALAREAWDLVARECSWESVTDRFEELLEGRR